MPLLGSIVTMDSIYACHFKAAGWAVAVAAYSLRIRASDTGRAVSPGLINLTLTIRDTPTYMMAVRLNYIHIYWIAIGSGSHLRRNTLALASRPRIHHVPKRLWAWLCAI